MINPLREFCMQRPLYITQQDLIWTTINFPGIDNKRVSDRGEVIRPDVAKKITMWVEVQHASFRETTRCRDTVLHSGNGTSRPPNIIHNQSRPAAQFVLGGELDELRPHHKFCLLTS